MERYEKVEKIGSGTFGMVHLIRRRRDGKQFALKRVPLDKDATDETKAINNEVRSSTYRVSLGVLIAPVMVFSDLRAQEPQSRQRRSIP